MKTDRKEHDTVRSGLATVHGRRPAPPRTRRVRTLAGALAVLAAAGVLLTLGPWGDSPAAWAANPRALTAEQQESIARACTVSGGDAPALPPTAVIDWRGSRVVAFFADDAQLVECVLDSIRGDDIDTASSIVMSSDSEDLTITDGQHLSHSPAEVETAAGARYALVVGRITPQVERVTVSIPGHGDAEASIGHGWFSIWWPGRIDGATLRAYDAQDRAVARAALSLE